MPTPREPVVDLSVVSPAHDERENLRPLVEQIVAAVEAPGRTFEIIIVDDGSTDGTADLLAALRAEDPRIRSLKMTHARSGRGIGQSAAFAAGFRAARGAIVVSLDADLQNDPADIPALLEALRASGADMVQGDRSRARQDTLVRRASSVVGRLFRRGLLGDTIRDTGCSLRAMRREVAVALPLEYRGMHRFIPVVARQLGYRVVEMPVGHRPRTAGVTGYGVWNRALPGLIDCFAVRWMRNRRRRIDAVQSADAPLITVDRKAAGRAASAPHEAIR